jgi:formate C-acetyltransferase
LSCLCLKVTRELRVWQPSVSVRIGPGTSDAFWDLALELCAEGFGMPSFFNDPVVIRAVQATGIPVERARDWAVVGCYEATPQGDCLARTVHGNWVLASTFRRYLDSCSVPGREPDTFADFRQGLKAFLAADYAALVPQFQNAWNWMRDHQASPFRSVCMEGCCESGLCAEEGGTRHKLFGVDILGLGTLVDSVWAVQRLVYEEGAVTLAELCEQLAQDLPDARFLSRCRNLPGKYGSDSPATNALASELAHHVADLVLESRMEHGVQPFPAFFIFTAWAQLELPATPDGRRSGEPVSYGVGPSVYAGYRTPTGMLRSAAVAAHDRCACGNPMLLTLDHRTVQGRDGRARIRQLVEAYFEQGGFHLHFNVLEADELRDARQNPARHMDLLVRISGLSAQFVSLEARLQAALIERAEAGM